MPKKTIPRGVEEGVVNELAAVKKGAPGTLQKAADHWGLTDRQVKMIQQRNSSKIDDLRGTLSEAYLLLAGQMAGQMSLAMADEARMREMPVRDMAQSIEKLTNAGVTAAEGHRPNLVMNFGQLLAKERELEAADAQLRQMRQARGREVA